jgi:alkyldihydroxyacetonephosphate synthase
VSYKQSPVFRAGVYNDTMEVAAPWSRLDAVYRNVRRALSRHALVMAHMSHAYPDGCSVYFTFVGVSRSDAEAEHAEIWRDALQATHEAGGVVSHHHGVGRLRKEALLRELGPGALEAYGALKRAWDPNGVMNPGSPFEPTGGAADATNGRDAPNGRDSPWLVDAVSGLVRLNGDVRLDAAERMLGEQGLTLGIENTPSVDVDSWIATGMSGLGDPWLDPVEQRLAGVEAVLANGARIHQRPAPRRATGPDLSALFVGAERRVGRVESAWLRAKTRDAAPARPLAFGGERDPELTSAERAAFLAIAEAFE